MCKAAVEILLRANVDRVKISRSPIFFWLPQNSSFTTGQIIYKLTSVFWIEISLFGYFGYLLDELVCPLFDSDRCLQPSAFANHVFM